MFVGFVGFVFATHCLLAATTAAGLLGTADPNVICVAIATSMIPDMDTTKSYPGRIIWPLARWLEERFPHRSVTHSFLLTLVLAIAAIPVFYYTHSWQMAAALPLGQATSAIADTFTKAGSMLFWPARAICVAGRNPRYRLETGSAAELPVALLAMALLCLFLWFNTGGGFTAQFAQWLFPNADTAIELFEKHGTTHSVIVDVEGTHTSTSRRVKETFTVLDHAQHNLMVANAGGALYKVGQASDCQIRPTKIKSRLGSSQTLVFKTQDIIEADAAAWLGSLSPQVYLSGELVVEEPEELVAPSPELDTMPTVAVAAGKVTLHYARSNELSFLQGFWISTGRVVIKEVVRGSANGMAANRQ
jgi:inner membrane protein